jgi:hypothetical protein
MKNGKHVFIDTHPGICGPGLCGMIGADFGEYKEDKAYRFATLKEFQLFVRELKKYCT